MDIETKNEIRRAYLEGKLEVKAVCGESVEWKPVKTVLQHKTPHKRAFRVATSNSQVEATEDHSLFLLKEGSLSEIETSSLKVGDALAVVRGSELSSETVTEVEEMDPLSTSYDLSVPGPENFVLANGIVAHNSYSIGGVSLDIEKSSKYESAANNFKDLFSEQLERAKRTVKFTRGLQQPRFGIGVRSSFGPYSSRGALTPSKFIGF